MEHSHLRCTIASLSFSTHHFWPLWLIWLRALGVFFAQNDIQIEPVKPTRTRGSSIEIYRSLARDQIFMAHSMYHEVRYALIHAVRSRNH